jgi:16S rRNA (uracil1498-N3)-methyltransferase
VVSPTADRGTSLSPDAEGIGSVAERKLISMAEHRFYLEEQLPGIPGCEVAITGEPAHRIASVLRMRAGERLALFDGSRELECELLEVRPRVKARVIARLPDMPPSRHLTLFQALIRPNRFEWLIEKVTEIGVSAIVPVVTERVAVRARSIGAGRFDRWSRIAIEASEQSGRRCLPALREPLDFAVAVKSAPKPAMFAWEGMRAEPASRIESDATELSLFIGPEGGWSEDEVALARREELTFMSLGPNTLRSETAAVVAAAFLLVA